MRVLRIAVVAWLVGVIASGAACAVSVEQEPGCQSDDECSLGFTCRAGACFRVTTGLHAPADAGDAGDAASE